MKPHTFLLLAAILFVINLSSLQHLQAQDNEDDYVQADPLDKPLIWTKLENRPTDERLWEAYFGRDLFSLSTSEIALYERLKSLLQAAERNRLQLIEFIKNQRNQSNGQNFAADVELDPYYYSLVDNIRLNFALIEDYFKVQFKKYNLEYFTYEEMHGGTDYSQTKFIDEQELRLKEGIRAKELMESAMRERQLKGN